tara:strand:+ start:510 stop:716 length:207 start_codon:yes stop_codon:yes gene_type:complete
MKDDWIKVKAKNEGLFAKEAKKNNMGTEAYATKVIKELKGKTNGDKNKVRKLRRAVFAKNAMAASKKK